MKLVRFGNPGNEKPGFIDGSGKRKDVSHLFTDWNRETFQKYDTGEIQKIIKAASVLPEIPENVRWASCVARPGKVLCIGLNYADHARESGLDLPKEPILFQKGANTVVGPYDNILIPRKSTKTDWEVELGIIIAKDARYLDSLQEAEKYIAGYTISHDVSEREFQIERGGQWTKGKSCDNFNPLGPWLVTADEIEDVNHLSLQLSVNGKQMQKGNTASMIFDCFFLVHYLSQFMTLEAGDLINTGTPPGVGLGMNPQQYLKEGDIVELSIEGLGFQKQTCINA